MRAPSPRFQSKPKSAMKSVSGFTATSNRKI
jgi:hypothetical protein